MIWFFYNFLFVLGFLLLLPRFLYRMWRRGGYGKHFTQRFARYDAEIRRVLSLRSDGNRIWMHAVSVGEINIAFACIDEWRRRRPGICFVLSTTTSTAYALAAKRLAAPDVLVYFPVDLPFIQRRALRVLRPKGIVLVEAEWWPNLLREAERLNIPVALINGRVSDPSFRGYQ